MLKTDDSPTREGQCLVMIRFGSLLWLMDLVSECGRFKKLWIRKAGTGAVSEKCDFLFFPEHILQRFPYFRFHFFSSRLHWTYYVPDPSQWYEDLETRCHSYYYLIIFRCIHSIIYTPILTFFLQSEVLSRCLLVRLRDGLLYGCPGFATWRGIHNGDFFSEPTANKFVMKKTPT